jgi:bacillithiol biosynthesis deacetylase BshB1
LKKEHVFDFAVFGPHPDDVELACGGTIKKMADLGYDVAVVDLTRGEMGSRGTPQTRTEEAARAAAVLGVKLRENLDLPDCDLRDSQENRVRVAACLRRLRPRFVLLPYPVTRHPDHYYASLLVEHACFFSGVKNFPGGGDSFRPAHLLFYMGWPEFTPSFIVDISDHFEEKMKAVRCFGSQFYDPRSKEKETLISSPAFFEALETRARYYGLKIGARYGEPFYIRQTLGIDDPAAFFSSNRNFIQI